VELLLLGRDEARLEFSLRLDSLDDAGQTLALVHGAGLFDGLAVAGLHVREATRPTGSRFLLPDPHGEGWWTPPRLESYRADSSL
jgi:hypothetical protein